MGSAIEVVLWGIQIHQGVQTLKLIDRSGIDKQGRASQARGSQGDGYAAILRPGSQLHIAD